MANLSPPYPILLVDDESDFRLSVSLTLKTMGFNNLMECADSREVMGLLQKTKISVILLDLTMPYISGESLVPQIHDAYPEIPVIVMTAVTQVEVAVQCMRSGAHDFISKPADRGRILASLKHALAQGDLLRENRKLKNLLLENSLAISPVFAPIITQNKRMHQIFGYLEAVSQSSLPVLITGETGVGKEQIAKSVHTLSGRTGQFVALNVAGLDSHLFSDTLFGHKKGAYTGAEQDRNGLIETAHQGTLFLDEIGDLGMDGQVKLLRLLQEGRYYPLGSDIPRISQIRIIVATHQNLDHLKAEKKFRDDLYYRLQYHHIHIPPLRERLDDLPLLVKHFAEKGCAIFNREVMEIGADVYETLSSHSFQGNIRELENLVYDAVGRSSGKVLDASLFRDRLFATQTQQNPSSVGVPPSSLPESKLGNFNKPDFMPDYSRPSSSLTALDKLPSLLNKDSPYPNSGAHSSKNRQVYFPAELPTLDIWEKALVEEALRRAGGNQASAARLLGLTRQALNNRLIRAQKDIPKTKSSPM